MPTIRSRVLDAIREFPGESITRTFLAELLELEEQQISNAIHGLSRDPGSGVTYVGTAMYRYDPVNTKVPTTSTRRDTVTYTVVRRDGKDGQLLLTDDQGKLWVAKEFDPWHS